MKKEKLFDKIGIRSNLSHLPTMMLIVGYIVYWIELLCFNTSNGQTSPLSVLVFGCIVLIGLVRNFGSIIDVINKCVNSFKALSLFSKLLLCVGFLCVVSISLISLYASRLPPHLDQEYDVLNYHYSIARQHLILNSFQHISWSSADLFLLPIQFALSPYWFLTTLPNKFPQFIILLGLAAVSIRLTQYFTKDNILLSILCVFAVFGSHGLCIQMGTAMLDMAICYLFLAGLDSFLHQRYKMAAVEWSFFLWAKSFIPLQMGLLVTLIVICAFVLKKYAGFSCHFSFYPSPIDKEDFKKICIKFLPWLIVGSLVIAGPFLIKSYQFSGTPLYPFGVGLLGEGRLEQNPEVWVSLNKATDSHLSTRDWYGYGRNWSQFFKHFWILAVPDQGVNNKYDYPLGLMYLVFLLPFLTFFAQSLRKKELPILAIFTIMYWVSWWFGSQQARFLYIPLILIYIITIPKLKNNSFILLSVCVLSLMFSSISVLRAHKADFQKTAYEVLDPNYLKHIKLSKSYLVLQRNDVVSLKEHEVAFAQFPVRVEQEKYPFVILDGKNQ